MQRLVDANLHTGRTWVTVANRIDDLAVSVLEPRRHDLRRRVCPFVGLILRARDLGVNRPAEVDLSVAAGDQLRVADRRRDSMLEQHCAVAEALYGAHVMS